MARADGTEPSGIESGNSGGAVGAPGVDIGSIIESSNAAADSGNSAAGKRIRRTREQLERDGYYEGKDSGKQRPAAKAAKGSIDVNSVQFALTGIHALLAAGLAAPELELSDTESETVAKNIVAVTRHYDLQQTAKATDWGNLVVSLGVVYGGRIIRISARKTAEKKARRGAVAPGTGFTPTPPNVAPQQPSAVGPKPPAGMPVTRPYERGKDDVLLNEVEPFLAP